jgi:AcrR family transcriptional regulator
MVRADAVRNRERVLDAAREAFARAGLGVPIDEIARAAGVGAGTVHRHFPTKESLYAAVLADRVAALVTLARSYDDGEGLFRFLYEFATHGAGNRALAEALTRGGVDVQAELGSRSAELKGAMADLLSVAQRAGTARADITPDDLQALLAAAHLAAERAGGDVSAAARVLGVLADGLRRRPDPDDDSAALDRERG